MIWEHNGIYSNQHHVILGFEYQVDRSTLQFAAILFLGEDGDSLIQGCHICR